MKIPFRQGIVRQQSDITNTPTFLQTTATGVTLNVSPDPTIINFAHSAADYLFEETTTTIDAWDNLPQATTVWLYWDLDLFSGERTFGFTTVQPIEDPNPPASPIAEDQHWFDITETTMKVRQGVRWIEKIRVFAGQLIGGGALQQFPIGTQAGLNTTVRSGHVLIDDDDRAVKKFDRFGRGKFITTETPLASQVSRLQSVRLEHSVNEAVAQEHIPEWYCVAYTGEHKIGLASYLNAEQPAFGIADEEMFPTEARSIITGGYVTSGNWDWDEDPGTPLFVGEFGELTITVPQQGSIQQMAIVVSKRTILLHVKPLIELYLS